MHVEIEGVQLECVEGDITKQRGFDAVVNAANAELLPGGGVAGAIHRAAGPELARACAPLAPIRPGEAVITDAFNLPNQYIIHCLGPVHGRDEPAAKLLASCYREALRLADEHDIASIAFPAISTGAFGYPMKDAATIAIRTITQVIPTLNNVKRIRLTLWGEAALDAHREALHAALGSDGNTSRS